ncbi:MAG: glutamine-hydrolyzing GMP synthase [Eubacteriales bacterium]|nr:glutamine-hydrolyzing GMP synthase [Eubacteriales bacterium]
MDMLLVLDFGGMQSQSVARRIRGDGIYSELLPCSASAEEIRQKAPKGLVLVGGPQEITADCAPEVYALGLPMLCLGYGARAAVAHFGGRLLGPALLNKPSHIEFSPCPLFEGLSECDRFLERADLWELPEGFSACAAGNGFDAAFANPERQIYGLQFYPEPNDPDGLQILANFAALCGCERHWSVQSFIEERTAQIRSRVGEGHALIAISGGVDSSVCAALMHNAIGRNMHCLHVDTGLMRKDESAMIARVFHEMGMDLRTVDASARFLGHLSGVTDPEQKRRIISEEFMRVFEEEAAKLGDAHYLVQGTIYPDVLETSGVGVAAAKAHHNVAHMPADMRFAGLIEPLRCLFKDEVRRVGTALGLPEEMVNRQPFPGPGLAVRCMGEVTQEKLALLREADAIFCEEIDKAGLSKKIWQYFAVLTTLQMNGKYTVALRAVNTVNALTATAVRLPYDLLETCVDRITSELPSVSRVVYDISGKPPATIEWE